MMAKAMEGEAKAMEAMAAETAVGEGLAAGVVTWRWLRCKP